MTDNIIDDVLVSQLFGNDPIAQTDTWYGSVLVKAGQHVYQVLAGQAGHNGIDIMANQGTPIYAPANGWIIEQDSQTTGLGIRVSLRHEVNGEFFFSCYGHMQRTENPDIVSFNWNNKTRPVKLGQIIGYVNSTGYSTGDHTHWGLYPVNSSGTKLYPTNGFGGAVDPFNYSFKKDIPMTNVQFIHKAGTQEYGFYVPAMSVDALKDKALNFDLSIVKADGSVDFTQAKEVTF